MSRIIDVLCIFSLLSIIGVALLVVLSGFYDTQRKASFVCNMHGTNMQFMEREYTVEGDGYRIDDVQGYVTLPRDVCVRLEQK